MRIKNIVKSSIISISIIGSSAIANDSIFVGVEVGSASFNIKSSSGGHMTHTEKASGGYQALKIGKFFGNHRIYTTINNFNTESDFDISQYSLGYDYVFNLKENFNPFIGIYASKYSRKESGLSIQGMNKDTSTIDGNILGIHLGTDYKFNKNHSINFGLRMSISTTGDDTLRYDNIDIKGELEKQGQFYLGYNYSF